ncbi:MAG: RNA repair transcriptional activator RtcR [Planctomycetota bacterium]|nr:RNA repair transcriptional activator RtcR [Planctomycetota bacterium]
MDKPVVVIGLIGTVLDKGLKEDRWERWRPTVSLANQEDFVVDRLELLVPRRWAKLGEVLAEDVQSVSPETEVVRHEVSFADPWDFAEVFAVLADFADAYEFDEEREDYLVHITTGTHVHQICLFLLTETRRLPARLLQTSPIQGDKSGRGSTSIIDLDLSRYDQLATRFERERFEGVHFLKAGIETRDASFNQLMDRIEQVALASDAPILLTGPTGVGKTGLARRIFELKKRHHRVSGELVDVNCATLRGDAAMSTLFGHEKGAFTGAQSRREGLLRTADEGLLFLDEVGELGLDEQAMLLRALEEGTFLPLGSDRAAQSRFQLIAGTNRDLGAAVRAGAFREDLLARIDLWSFPLPALRERLADIEPNLEFELERFEKKSGRRVTFNKEARRRFLEFAVDAGTPWTANFRDFGAAITRMATLAPGGRIQRETVDEEFARLRRGWRELEGAAAATSLVGAVLGADACAELDRFDEVQLEEVLRVCRRSSTLSAAGRALFAASRARRTSTNDADRLTKYLRRFGLHWKDVAATPE